MGMSLDRALYLQRKGFLTPEKNRVLDIGPQNVYEITQGQIREFVNFQGSHVAPDYLESEIKRLVYFSIPRAGERTTLLSEITDLTNVDYNSIDVAPGLKTEILDLNFDSLPKSMFEGYDIVLNFGTTEHIFNQWNCFEVIHDATKVGGINYHQLPVSGYLDHGYYCYTPLFFKEMAQSNGYEVIDLFVTQAGVDFIDKLGLRTSFGLSEPEGSLGEDNRVPCLNIHAVLKKTVHQKFRCALEVATTHAPVNSAMASRYGNEPKTVGAPSGVSRLLDVAQKDLCEANRTINELRNSRSWRITKPLRWLAGKAAASNNYR